MKRGRSAFKLLFALALCLRGAGASPAQSGPGDYSPTDVVILKHEWRMEDYYVQTRRRHFHVCTVKVRNDGAKEITGVVWDYVFVRAGDDKELTRFRFSSGARIGAGESATLKDKTDKRPSASAALVVSAQAPEVETNAPPKRHVELMCVLYADGTRWQNPKAAEGDCESLAGDAGRRKQ